MQEFIQHAPNLLKGILTREHIPATLICANCMDNKVATWRCRDCTAATTVCRRCMRDIHIVHPLHRIEMWTGKFFRPAQLWEAGQYILIPHSSGSPMCTTLSLHQTTLEMFHRAKDDLDFAPHHRHQPAERLPDLTLSPDNTPPGSSSMDWVESQDSQELPSIPSYAMGISPDVMSPVPTSQTDRTRTSPDPSSRVRHPEVPPATADILSKATHPTVQRGGEFSGAGYRHQYAARNPQMDVARDEENEDNVHEDSLDPASEHDVLMPAEAHIPRTDAMSNPYVRVVHTNGIHYIPLVICDCRGLQDRDIDLMYARLIPTSFIHYRTLFTTAVLDDFRVSNLECKASAHQYWQRLSRMTSAATSSADVDNFCRELRRLSRCWRWLKKLKWAGLGHTDANLTETSSGELAIFCPTCPQPGINLPADWKDDPNR